MRKAILQSSRILAELSPELHPVVEFILRRAGFSHFQNVSDRRQVLSVFHEYRPTCLFSLDCTVPQLDPLALLKQFRSHITEAEYLPILAVISNRTRKAHEAALSLGAKDLICPAVRIYRIHPSGEQPSRDPLGTSRAGNRGPGANPAAGRRAAGTAAVPGSGRRSAGRAGRPARAKGREDRGIGRGESRSPAR